MITISHFKDFLTKYNLTLFYRTATTEPTGIYGISVYGYSDTNTDVFYDHIDLVGLGNLDGPGAPV